jgi:hypothetical protein
MKYKAQCITLGMTMSCLGTLVLFFMPRIGEYDGKNESASKKES